LKDISGQATRDKGFTDIPCPKVTTYQQKDPATGKVVDIELICGEQGNTNRLGMYYEEDKLLGPIMTCLNCGYITGPIYGIPFHGKLPKRSASANGIRLS
jgi:hypothetical protein